MERQKREWVAPRLTVHGSVAEITHGCDKDYGPTDSYTFQGSPIKCVGPGPS